MGVMPQQGATGPFSQATQQQQATAAPQFPSLMPAQQQPWNANMGQNAERPPVYASGLVSPGTISPYNRPAVPLPGGGYATMRTITVSLQDGSVAIIPTVIGGRLASEQEAIDHFKRTREHFGIFKTQMDAENYDRLLHNQIEPGSYDRGGGMPGQGGVPGGPGQSGMPGAGGAAGAGGPSPLGPLAMPGAAY